MHSPASTSQLATNAKSGRRRIDSFGGGKRGKGRRGGGGSVGGASRDRRLGGRPSSGHSTDDGQSDRRGQGASRGRSEGRRDNRGEGVAAALQHQPF